MKRFFSGLFFALLILAAVFLVRYRRGQIEAVPIPTQPPLAVEITAVKSGTLSIREHYLGRIQPVLSTALASNIAGNLISVHGYPGDIVQSGKILIRVDDRIPGKKVTALKADLEGAEKELIARERILQRNNRLLQQHASPEQQNDIYKMERDLTQSKVYRLKEDLANARIQLGYAEIIAPFAGTILKRLHEPGEYVGPGEPIIEMEDAAKGYKIVLQVPQDVLNQVTAGATAYILNGGIEMKTAVTRIFPIVFSTETLVTVEIDVPTRPFDLRSGATVGVDLVVAEPLGAQVPLRALLENGSDYYAFKVNEEQRVTPIPVTLLGWTKELAVVSGKIAAGDSVIVADEAALLRLGEGTKVLVIKDFSK